MGLVSHLLSRQAQADELLVLVVDATIRGPNWALLTHRDSEHLAVVFCGINPGKGSAALGLHLANRSIASGAPCTVPASRPMNYARRMAPHCCTTGVA
ncbi:hypothetical protein ACVWVP_005484 [Pseudomonas sp. TE24901]